jgi:LysR family glycine cleavage system transcriptional activator
LVAGRLVKPFNISLPAEFTYYVVCSEADAKNPKVEAFRNWLFDEAVR